MTRLIGARTALIAWVSVHSVVGPPTGVAASAVKPSCQGSGSMPYPPRTVSSARRVGFGSPLFPWTGRVINYQSASASAASSIKVGSVATGQLVFQNAATSLSRPYRQIIRAITYLRDCTWTGVTFSSAAVSSVHVGSAATGGVVYAPTTGTAASKTLAAVVSSGALKFEGIAANGVKFASAGSSDLAVVGSGGSGVKSAGSATGKETFIGAVAVASRCSSGGIGTTVVVVPGMVRYKNWRGMLPGHSPQR